MSFKLVVDSDTVIQRLSLKDIEEVRAAVDSALTAAHATVQGLLCTTFDKMAHVDTFFLSSTIFPVNRNGLLCCRLAQGFVHTGTLSVVASSTSRKVLNTDAETVLEEDYTIDHMRGLVFLDEAYSDYWIKIAYTAGFDTTHSAPDWLREAVLAYLPHLLGQPAGTFDTAAMNAATEASKMDYTVAAKIVEPFLRNSTFQFSPVVRA